MSYVLCFGGFRFFGHCNGNLFDFIVVFFFLHLLNHSHVQLVKSFANLYLFLKLLDFLDLRDHLSAKNAQILLIAFYFCVFLSTDGQLVDVGENRERWNRWIALVLLNLHVLLQTDKAVIRPLV